MPHLENILAPDSSTALVCEKYRVAFLALNAINHDSTSLTDAQSRARAAIYACIAIDDGEVKHRPDEWLAMPEFANITILDPDGWDRSNFIESWAESITRDEMNRRVNVSTIMLKGSLV